MKRQLAEDVVQDISYSFTGLTGISITSVEKSDERVVIKAETGTKPKECSGCGNKTMWGHGSTRTTIHHVPIDGRPCEIALTRLRWRCPVCGFCFQGDLPECVGEKRYTKQLVEYLNEKCLTSKFKDLEKEVGISDSSLQRYAVKRINELEQKYRFPLACKIGIDEVKIGGQPRAVIMNLDKRTLIEICSTLEEERLIEFFSNKFTEEERKKVQWICTGMLSLIHLSPLFPNAKWVVDKSYVLKEANLALEAVRKSLGDNLLSQNEKKKLRKNLNRTLLQRRNDPKLDQEQQKMLDAEFAVIQATLPEIWTAYCLKEELLDLYDKNRAREEAEKSFDVWTQIIPGYGIYEKFRRLSNTVNGNREVIFNYWDSGNLCDVFLECENSLIQSTKRAGRGQTFETLRGRVLYSKIAIEASEFDGVL